MPECEKCNRISPQLKLYPVVRIDGKRELFCWECFKEEYKIDKETEDEIYETKKRMLRKDFIPKINIKGEIIE